MPQTKLYNQEGTVVGTAELAAEVFGIKSEPQVIRRAVEAQERNSRPVVAHTKTRSEVRGGGRKPWRQKGTGRARHGSIRSPIWVGGGVTFGPRNNRNFSMRINKKERRKAILMTLSAKADADRILVLDKLDLPEIKSKKLAAILAKLPSKGKKTLLVQPTPEPTVIKSARNIPNITTIAANSLNVLDVLRHDVLLLPQASLPIIEKTFRLSKRA